LPRRPYDDGFVINTGLNVQVNISPQRTIGYEKAIIVDRFNKSCGSCRIFSVARLRARMDRILPDLLDRVALAEASGQNAFQIPADAARWLHRMTLSESGESGPAYELVHALGRHIDQARMFNLSPLPILGAAKGCGHGNHEGPRAGALHEDKAIGSLSIPAFRRMFGLEPHHDDAVAITADGSATTATPGASAESGETN
jgi:hypothetical protein